MDTITHFISNQISHFNGFDRFSKFILIGNQIDGFLNFDMELFDSFSEVKEWLPNIIDQLKEGGEWALELYQVPADFRIRRLYGYYRVPTKGKKVFKVNYMNLGNLVRTFVGNGVIHFESQLVAEEIDNYSKPPTRTWWVFENNYTIHLHEKESKLVFELDQYPGDLEKVRKEKEFQRKERLSPAPEIILNRS
jgi:hypothetical protein